MNPISASKALDGYLTAQLQLLTQYSTTTNCPISGIPANEFMQITNPGETYEFICLGNTFVVKKEYYPFDGIGYLRTFEVILDNQNYPNKVLSHLPEMDIFGKLPVNTLLRFVMPFKPTYQGTGAVAALMNNADTATITDFGPQYMKQLYYTLENRYKHP